MPAARAAGPPDRRAARAAVQRQQPMEGEGEGEMEGEGARRSAAAPTAPEGSLMPDSPEPSSTVIPDDEVRRLDAHWRAANYLAVGQIYLMANPLLTEPLRPEHIKPRLL